MTVPSSGVDRFLIIKAKGGLGNRMLSAVTGLVYADLAKRIPVIDWRDGAYAPRGTNAYPLLFDSPIKMDPVQLDRENDVSPLIWHGNLNQPPRELIARFHPKRHSDPFIYRKYCVDLRKLDDPARVNVFWCYLPKLEKLQWAFSSNSRFAGKTVRQITIDYLKRYFVISPAIATNVTNLIDQLPKPIIGVHVRFSDRQVNLGKIERELKAAQQRLPGSAIFLATDNSNVQAHFIRLFERVYSWQKWFPEPKAAMHQNLSNPDPIGEAANALVDMYALARCDKLIYSRQSTFAYASKLIGDRHDEDCIDIDRMNPAVILKQFIHRIA
jgi:hypothetical protein